MDRRLRQEAERLIEIALEEDDAFNDITTKLLFPKPQAIKAHIEARQELLVCGLWTAEIVFKRLSGDIKFKPQKRDCQWASAGEVLAYVEGDVRAVLGGERVALNCLLYTSPSPRD